MTEQTYLAAEAPGQLLSREEKHARYELVHGQIESVIADEPDLLASVASIVCLLHNAFPYYFWTGFYRRVSADELLIGPYQGTLGCLRIHFSRGVCGAAARERRTIVVPDVSRYPGHIACDPSSASEIVVPVSSAGGEIIGVLDVDSDRIGAFDSVDQAWLERIVGLLAAKRPAPVVATR